MCVEHKRRERTGGRLVKRVRIYWTQSKNRIKRRKHDIYKKNRYDLNGTGRFTRVSKVKTSKKYFGINKKKKKNKTMKIYYSIVYKRYNLEHRTSFKNKNIQLLYVFTVEMKMRSH